MIQKRRRALPRPIWFHDTLKLKLVNQRRLRSLDLPTCHGHIVEFCSVDLRKVHQASGPWRPFDAECVADNRTRITVAFERPSVNDLASLLLDRRQSGEWTSWRDAGFLLELPLGGLLTEAGKKLGLKVVEQETKK